MAQVVLDQQAEDFSNFVENDAMLKTASYREKPRTLGCTPTDESYRVLRNTDTSCPLEARFQEKTPRGKQGLCCTSKMGKTPHPESLEFFRALRKVYVNTQPGKHDMLPASLARVLHWVNNSSQISDTGGDIRVTTEHERFMEILKFAMMTETTTEVVVAQGMSEVLKWGRYLKKVLEIPGVGLSIQTLQLGNPVLTNVYKVVNEVGVGFVSSEVNEPSDGQLVHVPPLRATRVVVGDSENVSCVDLADIAAHFEAGKNNRWIQRMFYVSTFTVVKSTTSIRDQMFAVFRAMRESFTVSVGQFALTRFQTHDNQTLPKGYTGVSFEKRDLLDICLGLRNSVSGRYFHRGVSNPKKNKVQEDHFQFECKALGSRRAVEVKISLHQNDLSIGLLHAF